MKKLNTQVLRKLDLLSNIHNFIELVWIWIHIWLEKSIHTEFFFQMSNTWHVYICSKSKVTFVVCSTYGTFQQPLFACSHAILMKFEPLRILSTLFPPTYWSNFHRKRSFYVKNWKVSFLIFIVQLGPACQLSSSLGQSLTLNKEEPP